MSEVTVQVQNPKQTININSPSITIEIPDNSIEVDILQPDQLSIQVQNPVIEVNIGGPCDCGNGADGNGIYSGSGTIPDGTTATLETGGQFSLNYQTGGLPALWAVDGNSIQMRSPDGNVRMQVDNGQAEIESAAGFRLTIAGSSGAAGQVPTAQGDGTTLWEDQAGGGGAASIVEITYADMETALAGATLTPGQFYNITDASGTDLGFICQAVKADEITVNGTGGYLNADFQAVGDYANTPETFGTQKGIWRTDFEAITIPYTNLSGGTFSVGDTITGGTTGATAVIVTDDGASSMTAYMTSAGVAFDGYEVLDNGAGVTADMNGAAGTPDIALGDVVIWNLHHFQLTDITQLNGTDPETNTPAYTWIDRATYPETYVTAWDISEFDFSNNWLQYRADLNGNQIRYSKNIDDQNFGYGFSIIPFFQWGNSNWYGNISDDGAIYQPNSAQLGVSGNILYPGAFYAENTYTGLHYFQTNVLFAFSEHRYNSFGENSSYRANIQYGNAFFNSNTIGKRNTCENNSLLPASSVTNLVFADNVGLNLTLTNNIIENGGQLTGITAGANCSVSRNKIGQVATLGGTTTMGDGAAFNDLDIRANKQISNKTLDAGVTFSDKIIQLTTDATETYSANVEGNRTQPGFSDIPGTIDITGLTTLDITAAWAQYRGIINLTSSNATETIDTITNPPTAFPFTIRPQGFAMTVTGTAYSGIAAGQIALKATDYVLDGDKGEYIVLEIDPLGTGCLVEKLVVNGLI